MKKGCLILGLGVVLLLTGAAFVWAIQMDRQFGWTESDAISHTRFANAQTKARAVVDVSRLEELILRHLPKNLPFPSWLPIRPETLVRLSLPREIALLESSDYAKSQVNFTLFVNERRGGPIFEQAAIAIETPAELKALQWDPPLLRMPERGVIEATAHCAIPDGLESRLLQDWPHEAPGEPVALEGGHLAELALDNRTGEIFTMMGAYLKAQGEDWRTVFDDPSAAMALGMLPLVHVIRMNADLTAHDMMRIHLRVEADPNAATALNLSVGLMLPQLQDAAKEHDLKLDGEAAWSDAEQALVGDFTLRGFEPLIARQVAEMFPAP